MNHLVERPATRGAERQASPNVGPLESALQAWGAAIDRFMLRFGDVIKGLQKSAPYYTANTKHREAVLTLEDAIDFAEDEYHIALVRGRLQAKRVFDAELVRLRHRLGVDGPEHGDH